MPRETETQTFAPPPADWRQAAEEIGRKAFEAVHAEVEPIQEPLSWLWKSHPKEGKKSQ